MRIALLFTLAMLLVAARCAAALPRETRAQADLHVLKRCLETFAAQNGRLPTAEEGLHALVVNPDPVGLPHWQRIMDELPADGWGRPYRYLPPDDGHPGAFGIYSLGADGVSRTDGNDPDDPNTWNPVQPRPPLLDDATRWFLGAAGAVGVFLLGSLFTTCHLLKRLTHWWRRSRIERSRLT